jgi:hypothetical protein
LRPVFRADKGVQGRVLPEVGRVFEGIFNEIEELCGVCAVCDLVVNRQRHIHHLADDDPDFIGVVIRDANVLYPPNA